MKQAAAPERARKTDSSRRTESSAGSRGVALAPPDYGIDCVDHSSAGDGPIQLNGNSRALQQKTDFDGISNSDRVMRQTARLHQIASNPGVLQQKAFADSVRNGPQVVAQRQRMKSLFGAPVQRREMEELPGEPGTAPLTAPGPQPNNTGLPDGLKSGVESLSGMSLDDVKVHYNSSRPARLDALAYAQGRDIHVAPGQERHLPHEAWHVVQQAQGRVQPTMQLKSGLAVNDEAGLEHEADVMGAKALQMRHHPDEELRPPGGRNHAGLPDGLMPGVEPLSRRSLGNVGVHSLLGGKLPLQRQALVIQRHHNYGKQLTLGDLDEVIIYKVVEDDNDKVVYVGQTCAKQGIKTRFEQHLKSGYHPGWSSDTHTIKKIEGGTWTILEAKIAEQYWIDKFLDDKEPLENARDELTYATWLKYRDDAVTTPNFKGNYRPRK